MYKGMSSSRKGIAKSASFCARPMLWKSVSRGRISAIIYQTGRPAGITGLIRSAPYATITHGRQQIAQGTTTKPSGHPPLLDRERILQRARAWLEFQVDRKGAVSGPRD